MSRLPASSIICNGFAPTPDAAEVPDIADPRELSRPVEVARTIALLIESGAVFEVRALGVEMPCRTWRHPALSGYFDSPKALLAELDQFSSARGLYTTLNPPNPALLARGANRFVIGGKVAATSDNDIVSRRWLFFDFDPVRPSDISSTAEEHAAALTKAEQVRIWLSDRGWPSPILADSGNGAHLLYRIELPNDAAATTVVQNCITAIADQHDDDTVQIDRGVFNAARICRLYGTPARKGDSTAERPHRPSWIVEEPQQIVVVSREQLDALAATAPNTQPATSSRSRACTAAAVRSRFDIEAFISRHELEVDGPQEWQSGRRWVFRRSPMCDHHDSAAFLVQHESGAIVARCHHQSCTWGWPELRVHYEPQSVTGFPLTDQGNAERFAERHGRDARFVAAWEKWLLWDGTRWRPDTTLEVERHAAETVRAIPDEAVGLDLSDENQRKLAESIRGWALKCQARSKQSALLGMGRSMSGVAISHEALDAEPYLVNCVNGTLDLRTGQFRPHLRNDMLTKTTGVALPTGAAADRHFDEICPAWIGFLNSVFGGDQELIGFVQRICGQALIGEEREHILPIFWGSGANGKSTFLNAISHAIGDYFYAAPNRFLLQKRNEGHPTEMAALHGKRFVSISETGDGAKLDEALVKSLTGGDMITARGMKEDFWSFTPSHTIFLSTNHKPVVRGTDHGMWRRMKLIPFLQRVVNESELAANPGCIAKDPTIADRLRAEAPAILLWLVDGAILYQYDGGLQEPEIVRDVTAEYRIDSDLIGQWLSERCILHPTARERAEDLYHSYHTWAKLGGLHPLSQNAWGRSLTERRYEAHKSGVWYRCGLQLRQIR